MNTNEKYLRITVQKGKTGIFIATSPDIRGLMVVEHSMQELQKSIPDRIIELYKAQGIDTVKYDAIHFSFANDNIH